MNIGTMYEKGTKHGKYRGGVLIYITCFKERMHGRRLKKNSYTPVCPCRRIAKNYL
jgi:hypothetical protein